MREIKSRRLGWLRHVDRMGEGRSAFKFERWLMEKGTPVMKTKIQTTMTKKRVFVGLRTRPPAGELRGGQVSTILKKVFPNNS